MTANPPERSLASNELLHHVSAEDVAMIERRCRWSTHKAGEVILDRDSDDRDVYCVVKGSVRIVNYSSSGREIAYGNAEEGGFFGELAAIDGLPRSAAVIAVEDCLLAAISPASFMKLLVRYPAIATQVLQRLANIIRTSNDRIMDLSTLKAVQRVCLELVRLTKKDAAVRGVWVIHPMVSHSEIASRASTTRETVARVIGQLSNKGIVERKHKTLYIRDKDRLEQLGKPAG